MVAAPAYNKPIACNRTVERDDVFRTQVVFHLRLFESGDEGLELLSYFPHPRVGGLVGRVHPGTGGGLQHEDVVDLLSGGKGQRKPRKIQVLGCVMRPPGVVCREGGGIIVFACARDTHERQVLVEGIYAQGVLPVAQPLHVGKAQLPSATAVGLAQCAPHAQLVGHAGEFFHRPDVAELGIGARLVELVEEHIDGRTLVPGVHGHMVGTVIGVWPAVLPVVSGPLQAFCLGVGIPGF